MALGQKIEGRTDSFVLGEAVATQYLIGYLKYSDNGEAYKAASGLNAPPMLVFQETGSAGDTVKASLPGSIAWCIASAAISKGDSLIATTGGKVVKIDRTTPTTNDEHWCVGIALEAATADGDIIAFYHFPHTLADASDHWSD